MFRLSRFAACCSASSTRKYSVSALLRTATTAAPAASSSSSSPSSIFPLSLPAPKVGEDSCHDVSLALQQLFSASPSSSSSSSSRPPLLTFDCLKSFVLFAMSSNTSQTPTGEVIELSCGTMLILHNFYVNATATPALPGKKPDDMTDAEFQQQQQRHRMTLRQQATQAKNWLQQLVPAVSRRLDNADWGALLCVARLLQAARGDALLRPIALQASRRIAKLCVVSVVAPVAVAAPVASPAAEAAGSDEVAAVEETEKKADVDDDLAADSEEQQQQQQQQKDDVVAPSRFIPPPPLELVALALPRRQGKVVGEVGGQQGNDAIFDAVATLRLLCTWCESLQRAVNDAAGVGPSSSSSASGSTAVPSDVEELLSRLRDSKDLQTLLQLPAVVDEAEVETPAVAAPSMSLESSAAAREFVRDFLYEHARRFGVANRTDQNKPAMAEVLQRLQTGRKFALSFLLRHQIITAMSSSEQQQAARLGATIDDRAHLLFRAAGVWSHLPLHQQDDEAALTPPGQFLLTSAFRSGLLVLASSIAAEIESSSPSSSSSSCISTKNLHRIINNVCLKRWARALPEMQHLFLVSWRRLAAQERASVQHIVAASPSDILANNTLLSSVNMLRHVAVLTWRTLLGDISLIKKMMDEEAAAASGAASGAALVAEEQGAVAKRRAVHLLLPDRHEEVAALVDTLAEHLQQLTTRRVELISARKQQRELEVESEKKSKLQHSNSSSDNNNKSSDETDAADDLIVADSPETTTTINNESPSPSIIKIPQFGTFLSTHIQVAKCLFSIASSPSSDPSAVPAAKRLFDTSSPAPSPFKFIGQTLLSCGPSVLNSPVDVIDLFIFLLQAYPFLTEASSSSSSPSAASSSLLSLLDHCCTVVGTLIHQLNQQQQQQQKDSSASSSSPQLEQTKVSAQQSIGMLLSLLKEKQHPLPLELLPRVGKFLAAAMTKLTSSPQQQLEAAQLLRDAGAQSDVLARQLLLQLARQNKTLTVHQRLDLLRLSMDIATPALHSLTGASLLLLCKEIPGLFSTASWTEFVEQQQQSKEKDVTATNKDSGNNTNNDAETNEENDNDDDDNEDDQLTDEAAATEDPVALHLLDIYQMARSCNAPGVIEKLAEAELMRVPPSLPTAATATGEMDEDDLAQEQMLCTRWALRSLLVCEVAASSGSAPRQKAARELFEAAGSGAAEVIPALQAWLFLCSSSASSPSTSTSTSSSSFATSAFVSKNASKFLLYVGAHLQRLSDKKKAIVEQTNSAVAQQSEQHQQQAEVDEDEDEDDEVAVAEDVNNEVAAEEDEHVEEVTPQSSAATSPNNNERDVEAKMSNLFLQLSSFVFRSVDLSTCTPASPETTDTANLLRLVLARSSTARSQPLLKNAEEHQEMMMASACARAFRQLPEQQQSDVLLHCCTVSAAAAGGPSTDMADASSSSSSSSSSLAERLAVECGAETAARIPITAAVLLLSVRRSSSSSGDKASINNNNNADDEASSMRNTILSRLRRATEPAPPINSILPFIAKLDAETVAAVLEAHFRAVQGGESKPLSLAQGLTLLRMAGQSMCEDHQRQVRDQMMSLPPLIRGGLSSGHGGGAAASEDAAELGSILVRIQSIPDHILPADAKQLLSCRAIGFDGSISSGSQLVNFISEQRGATGSRLSSIAPVMGFIHDQARRVCFVGGGGSSSNNNHNADDDSGDSCSSSSPSSVALYRPLIRALARAELLTQEFIDNTCAGRLFAILQPKKNGDDADDDQQQQSFSFAARESAASDILFLFRVAAEKKLLDRSHLERLVAVVMSSIETTQGNNNSSSIFDPLELVDFIELQYTASSRNPAMMKQTLTPLCDATQRLLVQQLGTSLSDAASSSSESISGGETNIGSSSRQQVLLRTVSTIQKCGSALLPELRARVRQHCAKIVHAVEPAALAGMLRVVTADPLLADQALDVITERLERVCPLLAPEDWLTLTTTLAAPNSWCDARRVETTVELLCLQYLRFHCTTTGVSTTTATNRRIMTATHVAVLELLARFGVHDAEVVRVATTAVRGHLRELDFNKQLALLESIAKLFVDDAAVSDEIVYFVLSHIEHSKTAPTWAVVRALRCACDLGVPFNKTIHALFGKAYDARQGMQPDQKEAMKHAVHEYDKSVVQQVAVAFTSRKRFAQ